MSSLVDWLIQNEPSFRKSRLPSLYSDLTVQKTTNPDGYAANVTAWQSALSRAALAGQLPVETRLILQTSDELLSALSSPQYGRPLGLGAAIDDSVRSGKMIDLREFQTAEKSIYHRSWVPSPWSILQWSMRQIGLSARQSYDDAGRLRVGNLVLVQALEELSKQILARQSKMGQGLADRIISRETFAQELGLLGNEAMSNQDLGVLLRYLQRDQQVLSFDAKTVKFKASISAFLDPITEQDTTIANLKLLIKSLESQTAVLNERVANLQSRAQIAVKTGSNTTALAALRSKKLAEKTLSQRIATLHQLEEVYANIEQAVDQVEIVQAMDASVGLLRSLNQKAGGVERVGDVVDRLREEMGKVDEVGQVINEPLDQEAMLDEDAVDEELAAMEAEQREAREKTEAEKTRRRLAELEQAAQKEANLQSKSMDDHLDANTKRLSGMSIEDDVGNSVKVKGQQEKQQSRLELGS